MLHIILVMLLTTNLAFLQKCFSPDSKIICCADYVWNNETKECDECPVGYHGLKCATLCPPPSYGRLCQNECICDNSSRCDPVVGCTTRSKVYRDQTDSTQLILVVMSVLAVVILLSLVFVLRKVCNRNERSESSILVSGRDKDKSGTDRSVQTAEAETE